MIRSSDKDGANSTKDQAMESLKGKMEGLEIRELKREEKSSRKPTFSTSSWADQVEDEGEYEISVKPEIKKEERTVPKRVYIQQTKVANMASTTTKVVINFLFLSLFIYTSKDGQIYLTTHF